MNFFRNIQIGDIASSPTKIGRTLLGKLGEHNVCVGGGGGWLGGCGIELKILTIFVISSIK